MVDPGLPWQPAIAADLRGLTPKAFEELQKDFYRLTKDYPRNIAALLTTGWQDITPQIAEIALLGRANRPLALADVQHYGRQMVQKKWMPTGETVCIDSQGVMRQGYHRMWACYLSGANYRTFVVADVKPVEDLFAFYDAGRKRSNVDALRTAGLNGASGMIDAVVKIADRYDNGALDHKRGPKLPRMTAVEVLDYVRSHPEMRGIIADTISEHKTLLDELFGRKKDVACFVACRTVQAYGSEVFENFMEELGDDTVTHGAVFLLRQKLQRDADCTHPLEKKEVLAFMIKAFNAWRAGKTMRKLTWSVDEAMPAFDAPGESDDDGETVTPSAEPPHLTA